MIASAWRMLAPAVPSRSAAMASSWRRRAGPRRGSPSCSSWLAISVALACRLGPRPLRPGAQTTPGPSRRRWASAKRSVNWGPAPTIWTTGLARATACSLAVPAAATTRSASPSHCSKEPAARCSSSGPQRSRPGPPHCQPGGRGMLRRRLSPSSGTRAACQQVRSGCCSSGGRAPSTVSISSRLRPASGSRLPGSSKTRCGFGASLAGVELRGPALPPPRLRPSTKGLPRKRTGRASCWLRSAAVSASRLQIARITGWRSSQPQGQGSRNLPS